MSVDRTAENPGADDGTARERLISSLETHGIAPKKRWGQNFLLDTAVAERIAVCAVPETVGSAWEIGPGLGAVTRFVIGRARRTVLFEIDWGIVRLLEAEFGDRSRVAVVPGDFLATFPSALAQGGVPDVVGSGLPDVVVGNLPYSAATAIVAAIVESGITPKRMVFMAQKEASDRFRATPNSKAYGSLSVLVQAGWKVKREFEIDSSAFYPRPNVRSELFSMTPTGRSPSYRVLSEITRVFFASRRKTIRNNTIRAGTVAGLPSEEFLAILHDSGVSPGLRAEAIDVETYLAVSDRVAQRANL
ncbi:MAG: ribosomal RNA small subunit methyltransferase A [Spirochaetaceae bacterium]|nr:MAG: ribosomal RNA small subunit methyltransferase A [Spirochaetaceae bacterium]